MVNIMIVKDMVRAIIVVIGEINYVYQGLTGNQACCVCGGGEKGLDFPGNRT